MRRIYSNLMVVLAAGAFSGCASENFDTSASILGDPHPTEGKTDLPNKNITPSDETNGYYITLAAYFKQQGFSGAVDTTKFSPVWPLTDNKTAVVARFGTPTDFPMSYYDGAYFHKDGFAVRSFDPTGERKLVAPVSGEAFFFYGTDGQNNINFSGSDLYHGAVAIWDPLSNVIVAFWHIQPVPKLEQMLGQGLIHVEQGETIGTIPQYYSYSTDEHGIPYDHTHLYLMDSDQMKVLNPAKFFQYHDTVAPWTGSVYLLNTKAQRLDTLKTGNLDVVLEVMDKDDDSDYNFEAESIAYRILNDKGVVLKESPRCHFEDMFNDVGYELVSPITNLIDFTNVESDVYRPNQIFGYALNQFVVDGSGKCTVLKDKESFVKVTKSVKYLTVEFEIWDHNENYTKSSRIIGRWE